MKNITLCCSAGMSTSLLVQKMEKEVQARGLDIAILAIPESEVKTRLEISDVILLGPQVRFLKGKITELAAPHNVPVDVIPTVDYGTMNGAKVLDLALSLMK